MAVHRLAKKHDLLPFTFDKRSNALVTTGKMEKEKVTLALPETFMNKSGLATAALARYFKIKPKYIFVVHDDIDLPSGK